MNNLNEMIKNATPEQKQKVLACKSANEILELAKNEGIELSAEQAEKLLKLITPPYGELSDEQLDSIAGGRDKGSDNKKACPYCESSDISPYTEQSVLTTTSGYKIATEPEAIKYICNNCHKTFTLKT